MVVVDDHEANLVLLQRILLAAGVRRVDTFTNPREALEQFAALRPDLVLLDLHMPGLDGISALARLLAAGARDALVPIVILTADTSPEAKQQAFDEGAADFVTKPFDRVEVVLRVRNLLISRRLHLQARERNAELQAELDGERAAQRRANRQRQRKCARIRRVLEKRAFSLQFQPIVDLWNGTIVGAEALARFAGPPVQPPNLWFTEAADVGLGIELEAAAVSRALEHLDMLPPSAFLSINVSPAALTSIAVRELVLSAPTDRIVVEVTEGTHVRDYLPLTAALDQCRAAGIRVAVDDTGAGYAGLQHLLQLRPDILKLDGELIHGIDTDPARRALVLSLVAFAAEVDATLVAECIETADELDALRGLGIVWVQGFHVALPQPLPFPSERIETIRPSQAARPAALRALGLREAARHWAKANTR